MATKHLTQYLVLVFVASWILQACAIILTDDINSDAAAPWLIATMFTPLLITLYFIIRFPSYRKLVWWKPGWSVFPATLMGVLIPIVISFAVTGLVLFLQWGTHPWFQFSWPGVSIHGGPFVLGQGPQNWIVFALNMIITGGLFAFLNGVPAAGEEFAWRGFLQQQLQERIGTVNGVVLLGVIWSMWHLPAQLAGYNYPHHPVIGSLLLSPLELIGVSLYFAWITRWAGSFIPAAIAHGAINGIQNGVVSHLQLSNDPIYEDLLTTGISLLLGLLCVPLLRKQTSNSSAAGHRKA